MPVVKDAPLRVPVILFSSFFVLTPGVATSASFSWSGAISDDWSTVGNWVPTAFVPAAGDSVEIDGTGAAVTIDAPAAAADLIVGFDGAGSLAIGDRFDTSSSTILGDNAGSFGNVEVTGTTGVWNNAILTVGNAGTGILTIAAGGQYLGTGATYLGYGATGAGTIAVSGLSSFATSDAIFIGYQGTGTFEVTAGGTAETGDAMLGYDIGSIGNASLSGAGSSWTVAGDLTVGGDGTGSLVLSTGATLTDVNATIGLGSGNGTSSVTLSGLGSNWTNSGVLTVGSGSDGVLSIYSSATASSTSAIIGLHSTGLATVGGTGSFWDTGALLIGGDRTDSATGDGTGTLDISTGGTVASTSAVLGDADDSTGTVTVDGSGSRWDVATDLTVGGLGSGSIAISGGASVTAAAAWFAEGTDSTGSIVVTGSGSQLSISGNFIDGAQGLGELKVLAGGNAMTGDAYLGYAAGGQGTALVSGSGSLWSVDGDLTIANASGSSGSVTISAAGILTSDNGYLGASSNSNGSVVVTGAGSAWDNSGLLVVGDAGTGTLDIILGGSVTTSSSIVGDAAGSTGTVNVTGDGSVWATDGTLTVGNGGDATVTVAGGGVISASSLSIATLAGSTGTVNIGAALGQTASGGATLDVDSIHFGSGDGALVFNFGGEAETLDAVIDGYGSIYLAAGTVRLTGNSSAFSGETTISGGELFVDGILGGSVAVSGYGILGGTGTVGSTIVGAGGTISPGDNGIGTLTVDGDLSLESGSTYVYEATANGSDLIAVTGALALNGGTLSLVDSRLSISTSYTLFSATGGISGAFDNIASNYAFVDPTLDYGSNSVSLSLQRNNVAFADVGTTSNQRATADAVESLGASNSIYDAVAVLGAGEARQAFQQLSGDLHASIISMSFDNSRFLRDVGLDRLRFLSGHAGPSSYVSLLPEASLASAYSEPAQNRETPAANATEAILADPSAMGGVLWGQAYGGWYRADGIAGEYAQTTGRTGGLVFGVDAVLPDSSWQIGALAGYGRSRFTQSSAAGDSDDYSIGVYAGNQWGPLAIRLGAIDTLHDISTQRNIEFGSFLDALTADYRANTAQAFAELGYTIDRGEVRFEPFANAAYVYSYTNGFSESGGAAALSSDASKAGITFTTLGTRAQGALADEDRSVTWHASLGWQHAIGDLDTASTLAFAGGDTFSTIGTPVGSNAAVVEAGLDFRLSDAIIAGLTYSGSFGSEASSNMVKATLQGRY